jgi:hypothetical protein
MGVVLIVVQARDGVNCYERLGGRDDVLFNGDNLPGGLLIGFTAEYLEASE